MKFDITGEAVKKRLYDCHIADFEGGDYLVSLVGHNREIKVFQQDRLLYYSKYVWHSPSERILGSGAYEFFDYEGTELFVIYRDGWFNLRRMLRFHGLSYRINSSDLALLGIDIKIKRRKFVTRIANRENIHLGILLSYMCWLWQQIRDGW